MVKLKSIELLGFKSFSSRTQLEFTDGITAIVGPNGCGKSNLADAIHWVLGEQSARTLRGGRMTDVIFNGTNTLAPTGLAEVRLTLLDPSGEHLSNLILENKISKIFKQNGQYKELPNDEHPNIPKIQKATDLNFLDSNGSSNPTSITISRRLFRSGESGYLMNGKKCRLRDIQELFMGMGLGPDSYAIIEQGRIGQILSSKPSDRKAILEEAAGISKFKTKKRLAESKLESSRENLSRVHDILEEVTKQVNSLKRQAGKARRFQNLKEEISGRMKLVLVSRWIAINDECEKLNGQIKELKLKIANQTNSLGYRLNLQRESHKKNDDINAALTKLGEKKAKLQIETERSAAQLDLCAQQLNDLSDRSDSAIKEAGAIAPELKNRNKLLHKRTIVLEETQSDLRESRKEIIKKREQYSEIKSKVEMEELGSNSHRKKLLEVIQESTNLKNLHLNNKEYSKELNRQIEKKENTKNLISNEIKQIQTNFENLSDHKQNSIENKKYSIQLVRDTRADLERAQLKEKFHQNKLNELRKSISDTHVRQKVLKESISHRTYSPENIHQLLSKNNNDKSENFKPLGTLADFVKVTQGFESLVENYLQSELNSIVVKDYKDASYGIDLLTRKGKGRSSFFIRKIKGLLNEENWLKRSSFFSWNFAGEKDIFGKGVSRQRQEILRTQKKGETVTPLTDIIHFKKTLGLKEDPILNAVQNAFIVVNAEVAQKLAVKYPLFHFLTPEGVHYHYCFVNGGKSSTQGPLAIRREIEGLSQKANVLNTEIQSKEKEIISIIEILKKLESEVEKALTKQQDAEKSLFIYEQQQQNNQNELNKCKQQHSVLNQELKGLIDQKIDIELKVGQTSIKWKSSQNLEFEIQETSKITEGNLRKIRIGASLVQSELLKIQSNENNLGQRADFLLRELNETSFQHEDLNGRHQNLSLQIAQWKKQEFEIRKDEADEKENLQSLKLSYKQTTEEINQTEHKQEDLRSNLKEIEPLISQQRSQVDSIREQCSKFEIRLARLEAEANHPKGACLDKFGLPPSQLKENLGKILEGVDLVTAEEEYKIMKEKFETFGSVNMVALEELEEAEERQEFLDSQEKDLRSSIEDTASAIQELERTSRTEFQKAFSEINRYFSETFKILFGGGIGEMRLDDENYTDSGLDVVAQPPGKRLQNVLLLSGGEKALTALALLIGIFRYRPSPFCLLDEVDAPLDESNVSRFTRLIRQLSSRTQFILITHNKKTMETAEVLYGVTMEEPGVSQINSVYINKTLNGSTDPELIKSPGEHVMQQT